MYNQPLLPKDKSKQKAGTLSIAGVKKFEREHKAFTTQIYMAFIIAVWVAIFGLPVYSEDVYMFIFGDDKETLCADWMTGEWVLDPKENKLVPPMTSNKDEKHISCGIFPSSYVGSWPNTVQMIIFTVFATCGNTVQLAWQGIAGTFLAVANIYFMMALFPDGAKTEFKEPHCGGELGSASDTGFEYAEWVVWVDTLGVIFLFLISRAETNTIKFGMSNHIYFMMNFMNPKLGAPRGCIDTGIPGVQWDSEPTRAIITSILGTSVAILATTFPLQKMNIASTDNDAAHICQEFVGTWTLAIEYICGSHRSAKRKQLNAKVKALNQVHFDFDANLGASWWETFDFRHFGVKRALYTELSEYFNSNQHMLHAVADACETEDFGGKHSSLMTPAVKARMIQLRTSVKDLLDLVCKNCQDGHISRHEKEEVYSAIQEVERSQQDLAVTYDQVVQNLGGDVISEDLANESVFMFLLASWARKTISFCREKICCENAELEKHIAGRHFGKHLAELTDCGLHDKGHVMFAIRNFVSISIAFMIGRYVKGAIFPGYSAIAPSVLSLLINTRKTAAFMSSVNRVLGVVLGKILPIVLMAIVNMQFLAAVRFPVHFLSVFVYVFVFVYCYLTSPMWGPVACAIAAFGTSYLLVRDSQQSDPRKDFPTRYQEMGQTVAAVAVQMIVDAIFREKSGREMAIDDIESITNSFHEGWRDFFDGKGSQMRGCLKNMNDTLNDAKALAQECDPKLTVIKGAQTDFRAGLYAQITDTWTVLMGDYHLVLDAISKTEEDSERIINLMENSDGVKEYWNKVKEDFLDTLETANDIVTKVLRHDKDAPLLEGDSDEAKKWQTLSGVSDLEGADGLFRETNLLSLKSSMFKMSLQDVSDDDRVRMCVIIKALKNATQHLGSIIEVCLQEDIFGDADIQKEDRQLLDDVKNERADGKRGVRGAV